MDTFCAHTAAESGVVYPAPVTSVELTLPDNVYSDVETTGILYLKSAAIIEEVKPSRYVGFDTNTGITYSVWGNSLILSDLPDDNQDLVLRYFAYYPAPTSDDSPLAVPRWSYNALSYLVGALALTPVGVQSANISQWKDKKDSGNPEDNALRVQQEHLQRMYEREILRYPRQDRQNYYRRLLALG